MTKSHPTTENNSLSKNVIRHALNSLANNTIRELRDYYEALEDHFAHQQKEIEKRYEKESAR